MDDNSIDTSQDGSRSLDYDIEIADNPVKNAGTIKDQRYLNTVLGKILPRALSEICEKRPLDPIEELARWLYQWADCELYYYEKAIFSKELQLMALQMEKENHKRNSRIAALKKDINFVKYLMAHQKTFETLMPRGKTSRFGLTSGNLEWDMSNLDVNLLARKFAHDRLSTRSGTMSFDNFTSRKSSGLRRKHEKYSVGFDDDYSSDSSRRSRRRRRGQSGYGSEDDSLDSYRDKRRQRRRGTDESDYKDSRSDRKSRRRRSSQYVDDDDRSTDSRRDRKQHRMISGKISDGDDYTSDFPQERKRHRKLAGPGGVDSDEYTSDSLQDRRKLRRIADLTVEMGRMKAKRKSKKSLINASHLWSVDIDSYGSEIKKKYGFGVTPVRCHWYLAEARVLVCVHPALGEMRATIPSIAPLSETPEWWQRQEYRYEVMYDHEIYTQRDPYFDDNKYTGMVELWTPESYLTEDEDSDE